VSDGAPDKPKVEIPKAGVDFDTHRQGVIGAVVKRVIEEMYFRNILAVMIVATLCVKEVQGLPVGSEFYMLAGLVLGLYFTTGEKKK
jgi:hypothetical protein